MKRKVGVLFTWKGVDGEKRGSNLYLERSRWREKREYYLPGEE